MAGGFRLSIADVFQQEGYFEKIAENLSNPTKMAQAKAKIAQMSGLLAQLNILINETKQQQASYYAQSSLRRSMTDWQGLTAALGDQMKQNQQQISLMNARQVTVELYILEREIIQLLIGDAAATTEYAVYYYGDKKQTSIVRQSLSAEKLYRSEYLTINKNGNLMLKRQAVFDKNVWSDNSGPDEITKAYKSGVGQLTVFEDMMGIISAYFEDLEKQYDRLSKIASKEHLGYERDAQYDTLRAMVTQWGSMSTFNSGQEANALKFIQIMLPEGAGLSAAVKVSQRINKGHLIEAFERIYQNYLTTGRTGDITGDAFMTALQESLGHDPWYAKGDVGSTQVKSFLNDSTEIRIASLYSIVELARWFIGIVTQFINKTSMPETVKKVKQELSAPLKAGSNKLSAEVDDTMQSLIDDFLSMLPT